MDEEKELDQYKPVLKNMFVKVICYICCFCGVVFGWGLPALALIFVEIRYRLIDTEKYDKSWYEVLRIQMLTIVGVYVCVTLIMYYL